MLRSLSIQNFALIEKTTLHFDEGFHVITGETGSGKSILLGALNQILGDRADLSLVRDADKKTVVEANFLISADYKTWFIENDIDFEEETIIRREFSAQGKSRAFVNDTPVQLTQLKELTEQLVYIHSQHETLELKKTSFQFDLVDAFGEISPLALEVQQKSRLIKKLQDQISAIELNQSDIAKEKDYMQFQVDEMDKLDLFNQNFDELDIEFSRLSKVDDLKEIYAAFSESLDDDLGPLTKLQQLKTYCDKLKKDDSILADWSTRINALILELKDMAQEASRSIAHLEPDPERIFWLTERLNIYNTILRKHGVSTQEELKSLYQEMSLKLEQALQGDDALEELKANLSKEIEAYGHLSDQLLKARQSTIPRLEEHLISILQQLKLEHARLAIDLKKVDRIDQWGGMEISMLFAANKGLDFKPIEKAASGGELSRVMLAIQATRSKQRALPTLILDEIDTGVSGDVASRIGKLLMQMGESMQLIAITHLPQVAAKGQVQFEVIKSHDSTKTSTDIKRLNETERIDAIATLISGSSVTDAARKSAMELMSA